MKLFCTFYALCYSMIMFGQTPGHIHSRVIDFPDVPGYSTLSTDFHQHSVFSDGSVWPNIRIMEAAKDSLDAISLTEHLEYQPWKEDIPNPDQNRAHEVALKYAKPYDFLVIPGVEITRDYPPGHTNALFVSDANKIFTNESKSAFMEAKKQGAFLFWNHPDWFRDANDAVAKITDMHLDFIKNDMLHGIEVVNEHTYSKEALQLALDHDLTIMGTSDIHGLVDWSFDIENGGHRPVTLVFAQEKSAESIKEALFDKRTVVFFKDMLIGREEHLVPLLESCITTDTASYMGATTVLEVELENISNSLLILANKSEYGFRMHGDVITILPKEKIKLQVKTIIDLSMVRLKFEVLNAIMAPSKHPEINLEIKVK